MPVKEFMMAGSVLIATDSAEELKNVLGDDATATFESDPKFVGSDADFDAKATASSANVAVQRDTDDVEDSEEEIEDSEIDDDDDEDEEDDEEEEEAETDRVVDAAIRL